MHHVVVRACSLLALVYAVGGCSTGSLDADEAVAAVADGDGVIADFKLGDSWEDIKSKAGTLYVVRDEPKIKQLRHDLGGESSEGWFISFYIVDGKAKSITVDIHGSNRRWNEKAVTKATLGLKKHFISEYGKARCHDDGKECEWTVPASKLWRGDPPEPDKEQHVFYTYSKLDKSRYVRAGTR